MPQPGDRLPFKGVEAEVVSAAGVLVSKLAGAGQPNPACASYTPRVADDTAENPRSLGVRVRYGAFRFVDLGDLSGNTLGMLVCPINLVGEASVYLVSHHGNYDTDVPAVLAALRPQVAIMNNGLTKGGAPTAFANLHRQPGLELWQLHASRNDGAQNADDSSSPTSTMAPRPTGSSYGRTTTAGSRCSTAGRIAKQHSAQRSSAAAARGQRQVAILIRRRRKRSEPVKETPPGWPRMSPAVFYDDAAAAIDWLCRAFGFEVRLKVEGDGGRIEHPS
jgi:hypothetical protein